MKAKQMFVGVLLMILICGWFFFPGCQDNAKQKVAVNVKKEGISGVKELTLDLGNGVTMKLARIPAGSFMMGSAESPETVSRKGHRGVQDLKCEHPRRHVTISRPFYMSIYEVTQEQYQAVMGKNPSDFKDPRNPVETVSWNDAAAFCKALSRKTGKEIRLPTEAEWEYACRAGTTTPFYTGQTISSDQANYRGIYTYGKSKKGIWRNKTTPVGSFKPNAFGLYDMHGNIWEWCGDRFDSKYYAKSPTRDPAGPSSGTDRVLRGGSHHSSPVCCRSAFRFGRPANILSRNVGFRVVCVGG